MPVPRPHPAAPIRAILLAVLVLVGVIVGSLPASAHPVPPGYDPLLPSPVTISVDTVRPDLAGDAFVLEPDGGLAQFLLTAKPGHDVVVLGYNGEPYLHIDAQGNTFTNRNSASTYINATTAGADTIPPNLTATTPPAWEPTPTSTKSTVIWHDHRIHWMQAGPPTTTAGSDVIQTWELALVVDGTPVAITGSLHRVPDVPWSNYQIALGTPEPPASGPPLVFFLIAGGLAAFVLVQLFIFVRHHRRLTNARGRGPTAEPPADEPLVTTGVTAAPPE